MNRELGEFGELWEKTASPKDAAQKMPLAKDASRKRLNRELGELYELREKTASPRDALLKSWEREGLVTPQSPQGLHTEKFAKFE